MLAGIRGNLKPDRFGHMVELRDGVKRDQYAKLFAAQPRDKTILGNRRRNLLRGVNEDLVARFVAMHIIDLLEMVQIDDEDPESRIFKIGFRKEIICGVHKGAAIGETGHLVSAGEVRHGQHLFVIAVSLMTDNR
ncbi:MAG: hypothetical protein Hens2KO_17950 [Henriciella sp.]